MKMNDNQSIEAVLSRHSEELLGLPDVVGTAQGKQDGKPCIVVMVAVPAEQLKVEIPAELGGYPVDIRVTGEFRAL